MPTPFETYLSKVEADLRGGKATEYTYRSSLELLMESFERGIEASNDPKHIECGAPDFIVEKRKVPLGYVETKDLGVDLNKIEKSDQLKRYFKALHNIILTDYLEFRWYVNGEKKRVVRIADVGADRRVRPIANGEMNLADLFKDFYATETPTVRTAKELASRLAGVTHFIREQISEVLKASEISAPFQKRLTAFKDLLLPALKEEEFADLYAQTMTYGLFAAKLSAPSSAEFTLASAYQYLFGNKFLRRLFSDVSEELDEIEIVRPYLLDIVSLLNRARFEEILADFGKRTRTEDPVVHFYETFLAAYDPKLRESRGVYYTPEPVVQFIVNSVDALLKSRFGRGWGLADPAVKVLDPATGTGTFLYYVIQKIHEEVQGRKQGGQWKVKSKELLRRVFGFELLIAPYVVSHLKLGLLLKTLDAPLEGRDERLQIYLTNTLEEGVTRAEQLQGLGSYIAEEASDAAHVKKMQDIMVVLGNPPYSNFGMMNKGKWILDLLDDYKRGLNERKINLDDDYIKFLRFGQWRINQTGQGILAFITNNSYINGLTHRQMRKSLMETFTDIYILDLHGSSKKKEVTPDGSKDENVFDIQQGVCISLFVKEPNKKSPARVHHAELWGGREAKYQILSSSSIEQLKWKEIKPTEETFFFVPKDFSLETEYKPLWSIKDIFTVEQNGLKTDRDSLFFDFEKSALEKRIKTFYSPAGIQHPFKDEFGIENSSSYDLLTRRENTSFSSDNIRKCLYRPFDVRSLYYSPGLTSRPAWDIMKHLIAGENLAFIALRQTRRDEEGTFFVGQDLINKDAISLFDIGTVFPLYLYTTPEETAGTLFAQSETTRRANLAPAFVSAMEEKLKLKFDPSPSLPKSANRTSVAENTSMADLGRVSEGRVGFFTPEDVFYYAYAVFHSPTYRQRYAEFLKIDFPRLPLTSDKKLFAKLVAKGRELVELHLLKSAKVEELVTSYPVAGDNKVEKVVYGRPDMSHQESDDHSARKDKGHGKQDARGDMSGLRERVWINDSQYFGGLPESVWEFKVGGYQVCEKWLKDRKGRTLSREEIDHYQRVVVALKETIRLMKEIDKTIVKWPME